MSNNWLAVYCTWHYVWHHNIHSFNLTSLFATETPCTLASYPARERRVRGYMHLSCSNMHLHAGAMTTTTALTSINDCNMKNCTPLQTNTWQCNPKLHVGMFGDAERNRWRNGGTRVATNCWRTRARTERGTEMMNNLSVGLKRGTDIMISVPHCCSSEVRGTVVAVGVN